MELATFRYTQGAWSQAFPALDSENTLVLAFAAPRFRERPELIQSLKESYPAATMIGCSTSGEIDHTRVRDESIAVAVVRFAGTRVRHAATRLRDARESHEAGVRIATELQAPDLRTVIVLSEGLNVNGSELVRGLNSRLREHVVVTGGLAGDGDRFGRTFVIANGAIETNGVVAVGLYGERIRVGHGSKGGWDTFGPERVVTRSEGNVLFELDNRPALALYKEYLGERAAGLPGSALLFPLALRASTEDSNSVVRTVLSVDEARQSMTFAGDIPVGYYAKLMRANFDRLILGAQAAGSAAAMASAGPAGRSARAGTHPGSTRATTDSGSSGGSGGSGGGGSSPGIKTRASTSSGIHPLRDHQGPALSIAISCVGRRLVLGERTEEETEATLDSLPDGTQQIGFYSYGEISPHTTGRCDLHNQTMTLTVLSETP